MKEVERTGPKPHPLDCWLCHRWWVVAFGGWIDWPPIPPVLGGDAWPEPQPDWLCLACGAEYKDVGDAIVYTGRVVDDEDLLLPGFAGVRESMREKGDYDVDNPVPPEVAKYYDDETIFQFQD